VQQTEGALRVLERVGNRRVHMRIRQVRDIMLLLPVRVVQMLWRLFAAAAHVKKTGTHRKS